MLLIGRALPGGRSRFAPDTSTACCTLSSRSHPPFIPARRTTPQACGLTARTYDCVNLLIGLTLIHVNSLKKAGLQAMHPDTRSRGRRGIGTNIAGGREWNMIKKEGLLSLAGRRTKGGRGRLFEGILWRM